ncbi:MAG: hypothetical protein FWF67_01710 [Fibromonadales bacterium]|nr:hypothetical protein [Fibromonadales bacterium]
MKTFSYRITLVAAFCVSLLLSCTSDIEMPPPPGSLSSSVHYSSSNFEQSSSSIEPSSSAVATSSSSVVRSSSSIVPSSSSIAQSSSSAILSSSSTMLSSSSVVTSSSSAMPSSSSVIVSSSSSVVAGVGLCANFVNGTPREHYGMEKEQFCDERDGTKYVYVKIGDQTWMAENLNYDVPNDTTDVCYSDKPANCKTYGRLYNWSTAMNIATSCNTSTVASCGATVLPNHQGICPLGWHLSSYDEWKTLIKSVGGQAGKLKAKEGWKICGPSGSSSSCEDTYGFAALPGGLGNSKGSNFDRVGIVGNWWNSNEKNASDAVLWYMVNELPIVDTEPDEKSVLLSVRCVQD